MSQKIYKTVKPTSKKGYIVIDQMSFHVLILQKLATRWVVNIIYDVRKPLMILTWCNIAIYDIDSI